MGKIRTAAGIMKTMGSMMREDWQQMDKKFYRLLFGIAGFVAMGLFWFYFLRNITPFGF
ncbi:MAG: hypothetical protein QT00_C0002G0390 [archaeon GW2011_AR5]|nr:MAG: hypothetical protein QT00_C0002G0390 [archaeon GW2011_AR5]